MSDSDSNRRLRVLVAKAGLDGHDRGAKIVAASLRDAGFEVIYTGLRQTPEMIVSAAVQEDVDAIGVSSLSGAHLAVFGRIMELLQKRGAESILVFGGGVIPDDDADELSRLGVGRLFGPGTDTSEIVGYLADEIAKRQKSITNDV